MSTEQSDGACSGASNRKVAAAEVACALEAMARALSKYTIAPLYGRPLREIRGRCWELQDLLRQLELRAMAASLVVTVEDWLVELEDFERANDECSALVRNVAWSWARGGVRSHDATMVEWLGAVRDAGEGLLRSTTALGDAVARTAARVGAAMSDGDVELAKRFGAVCAQCVSMTFRASENFDVGPRARGAFAGEGDDRGR